MKYMGQYGVYMNMKYMKLLLLLWWWSVRSLLIVIVKLLLLMMIIMILYLNLFIEFIVLTIDNQQMYITTSSHS